MPAPALLSEPAMLSATGTFSVERWALGVERSAFACAFTRVCGAPGGRALPFTLRRCLLLRPDNLPSLLCRVLLLLASPVAYRHRNGRHRRSGSNRDVPSFRTHRK